MNKLIPNISTDNITKLNELVFAGAKLIGDQIGVSLKNPIRNSKPGWEIRLEWEIKKLQQQTS